MSSKVKERKYPLTPLPLFYSVCFSLVRPSQFLYRSWHWVASPRTVGMLSAIPWCSRARPRGLARVLSSYGLCRVSSWSLKPSWWSAAACCPSWLIRRACSPCVMNTGEVSSRKFLSHAHGKKNKKIKCVAQTKLSVVTVFQSQEKLSQCSWCFIIN